MRWVWALSLCTFALCATAAESDAASPRPPEVVVPKGPMYLVRRPYDGFTLLTRAGDRFEAITTTDEARAWKGNPPDFAVPAGNPPSTQLLLDREGALHAFALKARGGGRRPAVDFFIDLWHAKTEDGGSRWDEMKPFFEGYVGDLLDFRQLENGRIVVPFAYWVSGLEDGPPVGSNRSTTVVSDDGGATWSNPVAALVSPCYPDHNGSNNGAVEPVILPLKDGRLWMLMRTQAGFLYESYSRDGVDWSEAESSRFHSSSGPPGIVRLPDGRIAVFWNNCEMPPRHDGQGVYGGRDALHGAVSNDEGRTWQGFREIYRDRRRNETPPHSGDRGTAYPIVGYSRDGRIMVIAGQGGAGRNLILIDPDWLTARTASESFENGLDDWCVFKEFGPASGWWRDRCQGPELVDHPSLQGKKVLHVRRPDDKDPDGAVWNFPSGRKGTLALSLMLGAEFRGGNIALANRFFNPGDHAGESEAMFSLRIPPDGLLGKEPKLTPERFRLLRLDWDLDNQSCAVAVDGEPVVSLPLLHPTFNGVCYMRIVSTADAIDLSGLLVESVSVEIQSPETLPGQPGV